MSVPWWSVPRASPLLLSLRVLLPLLLPEDHLPWLLFPRPPLLWVAVWQVLCLARRVSRPGGFLRVRAEAGVAGGVEVWRTVDTDRADCAQQARAGGVLRQGEPGRHRVSEQQLLLQTAERGSRGWRELVSEGEMSRTVYYSHLALSCGSTCGPSAGWSLRSRWGKARTCRAALRCGPWRGAWGSPPGQTDGRSGDNCTVSPLGNISDEKQPLSLSLSHLYEVSCEFSGGGPWWTSCDIPYTRTASLPCEFSRGFAGHVCTRMIGYKHCK